MADTNENKLSEMCEFEITGNNQLLGWQVSRGRIFVRIRTDNGMSRIISTHGTHFEGSIESWRTSQGKVFVRTETASDYGQIYCGLKLLHEGSLDDPGDDWRVSQGLLYRRQWSRTWCKLWCGKKVIFTGELADWDVSRGNLFILTYKDEWSLRSCEIYKYGSFSIFPLEVYSGTQQTSDGMPYSPDKEDWLTWGGEAYIAAWGHKQRKIYRGKEELFCGDLEDLQAWQVSERNLYRSREYNGRREFYCNEVLVCSLQFEPHTTFRGWHVSDGRVYIATYDEKLRKLAFYSFIPNTENLCVKTSVGNHNKCNYFSTRLCY